MDCKTCKENRKPVMMPVAVHESAMARSERREKRFVAVIILLIVLLVGSNCAWLHYESQFEDVITTIEADTGNGGTAIANGEGSVTYNGQSESYDEETRS